MKHRHTDQNACIEYSPHRQSNAMLEEVEMVDI